MFFSIQKVVGVLFVFKIVIHIGHGREELFGVSHILQPIAQFEYNHLKEKIIISIHHTVKLIPLAL